MDSSINLCSMGDFAEKSQRVVEAFDSFGEQQTTILDEAIVQLSLLYNPSEELITVSSEARVALYFLDKIMRQNNSISIDANFQDHQQSDKQKEIYHDWTCKVDLSKKQPH